MRKNLKLFKSIMIEISKLTCMGGFFSSNINIKKHSPEEIAYNLTLLINDNYIEAKEYHTQSKYDEYLIFGLTNKGEDYLKSLETGKLKRIQEFILDGVVLKVAVSVALSVITILITRWISGLLN